MTGVGSVGQLVAVIQSQLSGRTRQAARAPARRTARPERESLADLIALRVAQIGPDDPHRGRKAFRVFLESVLLQELGAELSADPAFHTLIDDVQRALEADARCAPLVQEAISQLLGAKPAQQPTGKP